ncbi:MAG: glycosyltransferase [Tepidisphaeraceae bacterium]|jgi:glycosyltransferase involved in cell wall biosynthesis
MSAKLPTISVALCTYNGGKYLSEQLQSLASQSRPIDQLVICDDASTDDTQTLLRDFAATAAVPTRIQLNPKRLGVAQNFQQAISLCHGTFIFLCDQDDRWRPDKVARLLQCFADEKIGLAFSNARIIQSDGSATGRRFWDSISFNSAQQASVKSGHAIPVLLRHAIAAGSMLAFRAKFLPLILPLPDLPRSHDIWISTLIASVAKMAPLDEDLIDYRLHDANQIGIPPAGLTGQIEMARRQIRQNAFGLSADLHQLILSRLTSLRSDWPVADETLDLLRQKIDHSRARQSLPGWPKRLGFIGAELRRGNYAKYSYGYKSVLQDLFLR